MIGIAVLNQILGDKFSQTAGNLRQKKQVKAAGLLLNPCPVFIFLEIYQPLSPPEPLSWTMWVGR